MASYPNSKQVFSSSLSAVYITEETLEKAFFEFSHVVAVTPSTSSQAYALKYKVSNPDQHEKKGRAWFEDGK